MQGAVCPVSVDPFSTDCTSTALFTCWPHPSRRSRTCYMSIEIFLWSSYTMMLCFTLMQYRNMYLTAVYVSCENSWTWLVSVHWYMFSNYYYCTHCYVLMKDNSLNMYQYMYKYYCRSQRESQADHIEKQSTTTILFLSQITDCISSNIYLIDDCVMYSAHKISIHKPAW